MTREGVAFYGVEVELLRIGDSPAAPRFNVVSKPNEFSKEVQNATPGEGDLSDLKLAQLEFWTAFRDYLRTNSKIIRPQKPMAQHWMNHSVGVSGASLASVASSWDSETAKPGLRAEVVLAGPNAKWQFHKLEEAKAQIEEEAGVPKEGGNGSHTDLSSDLVWENHPDTRRCKIYFRRPGDIADKSKWPEYEEWLRTKLEGLYRAFNMRLKLMQAESAREQGDTTEGASFILPR
jgi:hypothetical protein